MKTLIYENDIRYKLRGEQYYPCFALPEQEDTEQQMYEYIVRQMTEA